MKKSILIIICLVTINYIEAQITHQQANAIVTNQVFSSNLDSIDIYALPNLLTSNDVINLADGTEIAVPYQSCYAYFIDLVPFANWSHPCKYCFVNINGNHTVIDKKVEPNNWSDYSTLSLMQRPESIQHSYQYDASIQPELPETNPHLWAVLICANTRGDYYTYYKHRYWGDLSCVYTTLTNAYGFQENTLDDDIYTNTRILVFAPSALNNVFNYNDLNNSGEYGNTNDFLAMGPNSPGPYHTDLGSAFSYSKSELRKLFRKLSEVLTYEDQLFIYVTGYGVDYPRVGFEMPDGNTGISIIVTPEDLNFYVEDIKCSQMTLIMQNNFSGSFIDSFMDCEGDMCENRIVQTATNSVGYSYPEMYITRHNQDNSYAECENVDEFTYYWAASHLGYYPYIDTYGEFLTGPWVYPGFGLIDGVGDNAMPWSRFFPNDPPGTHEQYDVNPDTDNDGVISLQESYIFANNMDSWSTDGYYNPHHLISYGHDFPQSEYESSLTAEAATMVGYQGQIDGNVTSGFSHQPYRLCGDLWTSGPQTRVIINDDIYVPEGNKIYIKPWSYIALENCTIDKLPEAQGMWEGIQVWGQVDQHQDNQHQGALYMDNASIKNAIVAVDLWDPWQYDKTGGIFNAHNSSFINNAKGLRIEEYHDYDPTTGNPKDYNAYLRNCTFEVNHDFLGTETFYEHVKLVHVQGVRFDGCKFKLENPNNYVASWAKGILAFDANFCLDSYDSYGLLISQAEVNGLFMGIHAVHDLNEITKPFSVFNTNFSGNDCGIYARQVGFPTVVNSNFGIGRSGTDCAMGIYAEGINNFTIEQNAFYKTGGCPQNNYGVVIKNSNSMGTKINNNDFSDLYCGNLAIGDNSFNDYSGLEYRCNNNSFNSIDFYVLKEGNNSANIQMYQGSSSLPAKNKFSQNAYNFYNGGDRRVVYYYQRGAAGEEPVQYNSAVSVYYTDAVGECISNYDSQVNSKTALLLSASQKQQRETDYHMALNTYNSVKAIYNRLTDGGNTSSTVTDIKTAMPWQMWDLRAELLGASPYLSEEVLKETADRDDVFTESILFEILASNPDELKKGEIIDYVKNKTNPLPEYMTDILEQVAAGNTYKTVLLNQMSSYSHEYRSAACDIIRSILADSIVNTAELRGWLGNLNELEADREIIASYMVEGDYDNAFALANMLPSLYEFSNEEMNEHADYLSMLNLYRNLHQTGRNTRQLSEQEFADVEEVAENSTGVPQRMAQNILEATAQHRFADCPIVPQPVPEGGRGFSTGEINPELYGQAMGLSVEAKPNPATTWVAINFTLPGDAEKATLTLVNALGVKVASYTLNGHEGQRVLDLREFASGVYTCTITCGDYFQTQKIVITQ